MQRWCLQLYGRDGKAFDRQEVVVAGARRHAVVARHLAGDAPPLVHASTHTGAAEHNILALLVQFVLSFFSKIHPFVFFKGSLTEHIKA